MIAPLISARFASMIRRNLIPLLALSVLQLADAGTTYAALTRGAAEINPVASLAFGFAGILTTTTVLKLALMLWATIFACLSRLARPFLFVAIAAYALVVLNNVTAVAPGIYLTKASAPKALAPISGTLRSAPVSLLVVYPNDSVDIHPRQAATLASLETP